MTSLLLASVLAWQAPAAAPSPRAVARSFTTERCAAAGYRNCKSCYRPLAPGSVAGYDYRTQFDYPWSVRRCVGCAPSIAAPPFLEDAEPIPPPSARRTAPPGTRR